MRRILLKKFFIFGIIVLMTGTSVVSALNGNQSTRSKPMDRGNWLFVGGSGPGNYTTIQSAIDATNPGNTVFVYNGIYHENVVITITINLIGEDKNITYIIGSGVDDTICITANWVNVSGFSIENATMFPKVGIHLENVHDCFIVNNIICNNFDGFRTDSSYKNTIKNSIIHSNWGRGVYLVHSTNNNVCDNRFFKNGQQIMVHEGSNNNIVSDNFISDSHGTGSYGMGIILHSVYNNIISGNTISNNTRAFRLSYTSNNIIKNNILLDNDIGIAPCFGEPFNNNLIYHNNFINNPIQVSDPNINQWFNSSLNEGNYWSDYTGIDGNGDGIGNTPYNISGGSNQDLYPFMQPNGWMPPFGPTLPVLVYHMNETVGTNVADSSGNNYYGTTQNMGVNPLWTPGKLHNCLLFDGVDDYVQAINARAGDYECNQAFSVECWINGNVHGYYSGLVTKLQHESSIGWEITTTPSGEIQFDSYHDNGAHRLWVISNVTLSDNEWHHVIVTLDGSYHAAGVRIYLDGTLVNRTIQSDTLIPSFRTNDPLRIGCQFSCYGFFQGKIDEVVLYNKVLNQSEVSNRYNNGYGREDFNFAPNQPPTANFSYTPKNITTNVVVQFTDTSYDTDGFITNWTWDFGDGVTSTQQNSTHQYTTSGPYTVTLNVTDESGATNTTTQQITVINLLPNTPTNPSPNDRAANVDINTLLHWLGGDSDPEDTVTYDVYFGTTNPPPKSVSNQTGMTYNPGTMQLTTTFYWQIVSWDNHGASTSSPVWSFTTLQPGYIIAWGDNDNGQCIVPAPNADFIAISASYYHSLGLKANGSIIAWGNNDYGQCNVPEPNTDFIAVSAGWFHSLGLKRDGSIVSWGNNGDGQCNVPEPNTNFIAISAGYRHSLGLKADGSIIAWGWNQFGQCNVPNPNTGFIAISAGDAHSLGLKADGSIVAWGWNENGQCTVPEPNTDFIAVSGGHRYSLGLKVNGSIITWGRNYEGQCTVPEPNTNFIAISAGGGLSLGLKADGSIKAWGQNWYGQCNVPEPNTSFIQIAAGCYHDLGIKVNNPPYTPNNPNPSNNASNIPVNTLLSWTGGEPDQGDTVTYDIYFGNASPPPQVISNQTDNLYNLSELDYSTTYYWRIIAWDNHDASTVGPIWKFTTIVDSTPPVSSHAFSGTLGNNSWYVSNVTITLTAADGESGVNHTYYQVDSGSWTPYTSPMNVSIEASHTLKYYSTDKAGNTESVKGPFSFKIDKTKPTTSHTFSGTIGSNGWFISNVTITLTPTDATSGVNHTYYELDGSSWMTYVSSVVVSSETNHSLKYYSVDKAGNMESIKGPFTFKIDKTRPVTAHAFSGIAGNNNWYTSSVTITLTATDPSRPMPLSGKSNPTTSRGPSGVNSTYYKIDSGGWMKYNVPIIISADDSHTLSYYSIDYAGNTESVKGPFAFKIDQTAPTINLTVTAMNPLKTKWLLAADVSDTTSGIAKVEFYIDNVLQGTVIAPGPYQWIYQGSGKIAKAIAYDVAGNANASDEVAALADELSGQSTAPHLLKHNFSTQANCRCHNSR